MADLFQLAAPSEQRYRLAISLNRAVHIVTQAFTSEDILQPLREDESLSTLHGITNKFVAGFDIIRVFTKTGAWLWLSVNCGGALKSTIEPPISHREPHHETRCHL